MRLLAGILWGNMLSMRSRTEPDAVEPHAPGSLAPLQRRSLFKTGAAGLCVPHVVAEYITPYGRATVHAYGGRHPCLPSPLFTQEHGVGPSRMP